MAYKNPKDPRLRAARLKHYYNNKGQYLKRNKERKITLIKFLNNIKAKGCKLCKEKEIVVMVFHHLGKKNINISQIINHGWGLNRTKKEIKKCVILCANCHRKLHAGLIKLGA